MLKIEVFEDSNGEYRWRGIERNGRIIVSSAEGYVTAGGVIEAIRNVVGEFRGEVDVVAKPTLTTRSIANRGAAFHGYDKVDTFPGEEYQSQNDKLLSELTNELQPFAGERGETEGALDTLKRIIKERNESRKQDPSIIRTPF